MKGLHLRILGMVLLLLYFQKGWTQDEKPNHQSAKAIEELTTLLQKKIAKDNKGKRPKIGLTLSGGGAKGMAHIGILQAIDSAGLKIDYITGTSMGSVVGGLYAAGYPGTSIEKIARDIDWDLLFSTSPRLSSVSIEEKDEFNKYALEIPFENGKFKLGRGIIEGQELWLKFAELFQPVYNVNDFSKLPIPFKCMGTDLATGNVVVMEKGNIINCIRASMAIPTIFTPVHYEGKVVADGGMVNNFPVLEVKEMGADYVIGVNLNNGLTKTEDLKTMFDVLLQLAFFKDASEFEKHKAGCDVFILPDLENYSTGSFKEADAIIGIGKKFGQMYYPLFKQLAETLQKTYPEDYEFKKNRLPENSEMKISKYSVSGLKKTNKKFFFGISGLNTQKTFSFDKTAAGIQKIYGSRYYKKIDYEFLNDSIGNTEMKFNVEEYPLTAIKFGINYNSYTKLNLILNITSRDLIFKESRATATVSISENPRLHLEYYKYLGKNREFGTNISFYKEQVDFPLYKNYGLVETLRNRYSATDIRFQYNISKDMYVGLSQQYISSVIKTPNVYLLDFEGKNNFWQSYANFRLNTVDKKQFTTKGWKVRGEIGYIYSQSGNISYKNKEGLTVNVDSSGINYDNTFRLNFKEEQFKPVHLKLVFLRNTSLGIMFNKDPYMPNSFQVGGLGENAVNQVQFVGLNELQVKTGSIISEQAGLQWAITSSLYLTGRVNFAFFDFYGKQFQDIGLDSNFLSGYALTAGMMTPIGPIEISAMYSDQPGKVVPHLNLGFRF